MKGSPVRVRPPALEVPRLSVVVVTFNSREAARRSLPALVAQLGDGDELIVVDNASSDGTAALARELLGARAGCHVVEAGENKGFSAGSNAGAERASGELLLFVNPDTVPAPGFCAAIRRPHVEGRDWSAWMGLVTADGGSVVNTAGGVVHFTGIAWAGGTGIPLADPGHQRPSRELSAAPREVAFVSGACLAIPRLTWQASGGFPGDFFLYHEDVDLSLRLRLWGGRLGIEPAARIDHDYEFAKGAGKWRMLERNRWATILRTYPASLLALLAPALLATELALIAVSLAGGWGMQKLLAWRDVVRRLPALLAQRRAIQAKRTVGAGEFAAALTAELSSPHLGRAAALRPLRWALRAYWSAVRLVLRARGSAGAASRSVAPPL